MMGKMDSKLEYSDFELAAAVERLHIALQTKRDIYTSLQIKHDKDKGTFRIEFDYFDVHPHSKEGEARVEILKKAFEKEGFDIKSFDGGPEGEPSICLTKDGLKNDVAILQVFENVIDKVSKELVKVPEKSHVTRQEEKKKEGLGLGIMGGAVGLR